jgi:DNA-binding response OmpR family regulator
MVRASFFANRELNPVVVCVDDDPQVLTAVKRLLRREPYDLLTTDKPSTALRWIGKRRVDLLITDLKMPEMSGTDLIKVVEERSPQTMSLILTGFPEKVAGLPESRSRLIAKPWNDSEFKETVRSLVSLPQEQSKGFPILAPKAPFPRAQVLIVDTQEQFRSLAEETLAPEGFDLHVVGNGGDSLRALRSPGVIAEIVLLAPDAVPGGETELIRVMRRLVPGLYILVVAETPTREQIGAWYEAGAETVVPRSITAERLSDLMKRSVYPARKHREQASLETRESHRRTADPWYRRLLRRLRLVLYAPRLSKRGEIRTLLLLSFSAFLIGSLFARTYESASSLLMPTEMFREGRQGLPDRLWTQNAQDQALRRWYMAQQLDISHEMNEQTRRYHEEQLFDRRWEGTRPRRERDTQR